MGWALILDRHEEERDRKSTLGPGTQWRVHKASPGAAVMLAHGAPTAGFTLFSYTELWDAGPFSRWGA